MINKILKDQITLNRRITRLQQKYDDLTTPVSMKTIWGGHLYALLEKRKKIKREQEAELAEQQIMNARKSGII